MDEFLQPAKLDRRNKARDLIPSYTDGQNPRVPAWLNVFLQFKICSKIILSLLVHWNMRDDLTRPLLLRWLLQMIFILSVINT